MLTLSSFLLLAAPADLSVVRPKLGLLPFAVAAIFALWIVLLRVALPGFGKRLTRLLIVLSALTLVFMVPRVLWRSTGAPAAWITTLHGLFLGPVTVVQVAALAGLFSAPVWVSLGLFVRRKLASPPPQERPAAAPDALSERPPAPVLARRQALLALPWVLPGGAWIAGTYGVFVESSRVTLRHIRIAIPGLPPALHGFRIGQVTDIHISRFQTQLSQLERGLALLADQKLDLVCPTGDLCDEPRLHLDTLRLIKQVPARLGHVACAGNHELYLASPDDIRRAYEKAQIQLLEEASVSLGGLRVCGIGFAHTGKVPRLDRSLVPGQLKTALSQRTPGEPTLLLAHHPHVFEQIGGLDIALQLSGHTHGGQVGLAGYSLLSAFYPLVRGHYRHSDARSQLFVSAGLGHWLPFRVGCPPEVVVIELIPA